MATSNITMALRYARLRDFPNAPYCGPSISFDLQRTSIAAALLGLSLLGFSHSRLSPLPLLPYFPYPNFLCNSLMDKVFELVYSKILAYLSSSDFSFFPFNQIFYNSNFPQISLYIVFLNECNVRPPDR